MFMKACCKDLCSTPFDDPGLIPYRAALAERRRRADRWQARLTGPDQSLVDFASGHEYFGLHRRAHGWVFREWAPNASAVHFVGPFCDWQPVPPFALRRIREPGVWEIHFASGTLRHRDLYRLHVAWPGGAGERIPAYARRVVQDEDSGRFHAQVWAPDSPYAWRHPAPRASESGLLVYEAHVGMAQEKEGVGRYDEFRRRTLPAIVEAGYNTVQLMAVMEHPYYGSFGYHVSSLFAASSRFGTPEDLKALIDEAHGRGLRVIVDLIHSHAVKNEVEGLSRFDGTDHMYFHTGARGLHQAWDSRCFDYGKPETLHFLLSNCRFWLDEYRLDGFRFDGVTSMLYRDHGLGTTFDHADRYFDDNVDEDALAYLTLANRLVHELRPHATTVAEDVSGMPGLAAPERRGGAGFDCRLAMGVPDCWFKLIVDTRDQDWDMGWLWHELTNRRSEERTISYVESHDQAIVGGKTAIFAMLDAAMYHGMGVDDRDSVADRGMALHKMMRLATLGTADCGYLTFMGNEFGHPEWVDFPREGNDWSYRHARRLWRLRDDPNLKYRFLYAFEKAMLALFRERRLLGRTFPRALRVQNDEKVIVFERGGLLFLFNFDPVQSRPDYAVETPPGRYDWVMDTDEGRFGGHERLEPGQRHVAEPTRQDRTERHRVRVYLPSRCALVLNRVAPGGDGKTLR